MDLLTGLPLLARRLGADYYGVADLGSAEEFVSAQGREGIARFPRAVVMGIVLLGTVVDLLPKRADPAAAVLYHHTAYDVVNQALDQIGLQIANTLRREGFQALPVPASKRTSDEKIAGIFSRNLLHTSRGLAGSGRAVSLLLPTLDRGYGG